MATDDRQVLVVGQASAPASFTVPGNGQITPRAVYAHYDGTSAAGSFKPALKITSDGGKLIGIYPISAADTLVAGASAEVSWFPRVATTPQATGLPATESLFLDTASTGVTASTVLQSGVSYLVTVQGTYSVQNGALTTGVPEPNAMFPTSTAGRVSLQVGQDADTMFAFQAPGPPPGAVGHFQEFQINLGSGYAHVEPFDGSHTAPVTGHLYTYQLTGQGSAPSFRINDTPLPDNYGKLQIVIYNIPGGGVSGTAGGDLSGTYPNPAVAAIHETSGPTKLTIGSVPDGDFLQRSGSTLIGAAGAGGVSSFAQQGQAALTGAVTISPGAGVSMSEVGQNVAISSTASGSGSTDGWLDDTAETWTFASFAAGPPAVGTFTISGDLTTKYTVGTRIKLTQTTVKFFVVTADPVFGGGNTTVTISGGTDYTLANAAISANYHSYSVNPQGYPTSFNFTPATTGVTTVTVSVAVFALVGRNCTVSFDLEATSNLTTKTFTLPIAPTISQARAAIAGRNAGSNLTNAARISVSSSGGTTATLSLDWASAGWQNSLGWFCIGNITYPC